MKIKKIIILFVNLIIVTILSIFVLFYVNLTNSQYVDKQKELFVSDTITAQESLHQYLKGEQQLVNSWAKYINDSKLTLEEGYAYLKKSVGEESHSVHIISKETYMGYSTRISASGSELVSYANTSRDDTAAETIVQKANVDIDGINMLPSFPDLVSGTRVVGFCQNVQLIDGDTVKAGLLIRYLEQSILTTRWSVNSSVENAYCALIDTSGNYIIRPIKMKNNSFYEYVFTNNRSEYNTVTIKNLMTSKSYGSFTAFDQNDNRIYYSWSTIQEENSTSILIHAVQLSNFNSKGLNHFIVYIIEGVLVSLLIINLVYFTLIGKRETKLRTKLETNMQIVKRQEVELKDALEAANQSSKAKSMFLNNMSHDIRTPMNAIIGYTSMAQKNLGDEVKVEDSLNKIMISSQHLLGLINDILDMSKIESGKMTLDYSPVNLGEILHNLKNIIQTRVSSKNLNLSMNTINVEHLNVVCDKLRLNQILINLLSNSIKFTESGGTITVNVEELMSNNPLKAKYQFSVIDTGIGMSEEFQNKIFDRFEREKTSTVSKTVGTGLGMSIVKSLVDLMEGSITLESKQGHGTRFDVFLSFDIVEDMKEIDYSIDQLRNARALIVDDEFTCCDSINKMLRKIGMNSEWTLYGKEAVLRAKKAHEDHEQFDVFIIDWIMPDMNGVEVVRQIRAVIDEDTPIIILTAYDFSSIEEEARKAGVTAFLSKPLFIDDLTKSLSTALGVVSTDDGKKELVPRFENTTCLLVDDNEFNREIAIFVLEEHGIKVEVATNGKEAVDRILPNIKHYDIVFMDIQMPKMDGLEATRIIRESNALGAKELPIIAMTANSFKEDIEKSIEAGMNAHIIKPIDEKKLEAVLMQFLKK